MPTQTIRHPVRTTVEITLGTSPNGNTLVLANDIAVIEFTKSGHIRRIRGLPSETGLRRLPDGRVAIKPARD